MSDLSWRPDKPQSRIDAEKAEELKMASSIGVVQEVIDWFNANAELYASLDALGIDETTPPDEAKMAVLVSKKIRAAFQAKSHDFSTEFRQYIEEKTDEM